MRFKPKKPAVLLQRSNTAYIILLERSPALLRYTTKKVSKDIVRKLN
ncbi:hypothetical protein IG631_22934 [Alternaria alternata]|nr:hypothetical protein IG631_22934 [Alternaria alternata]